MRYKTAGLMAIIMFSCFAFGAFAKERSNKLPPFFTYLRSVDASIIQEMRYYGSHNFVGRPVKGYLAPECILTIRAALALKRVQKRLKAKGLSLKVYDCYRPARAVKDFVNWSQRSSDELTKGEFYPTLQKKNLFKLKYIARRSAHSRGSTVDLSIVPLPPQDQPKFDPESQVACHEKVDKRYGDNSLDFGTGFDCFHELSHTKNPEIGEIAKRNRALLVDEMQRAGFDNYRREWWHFSLRDEPYKQRIFDFPILPYNGKAWSRVKQTQEVAIKEVKDAEVEEPLLETGPLRVVCVHNDDVLNVRRAPNGRAALVGTLAFDALDVFSFGCLGPVGLADWHSLDAIGRKTEPMPWCKVQHKFAESSHKTFTGWVSGAFVISKGESPRACK